MQMTAAGTRKHHSPFTLESVDIDAPRHDEIRVHTVAADICRADGMPPAPLPVAGHEGAGVTALAPVDRVMMA